MKIYYYRDRLAAAKLNADGLDYTPAYLPALMKTMGFTAEELQENNLSNLQSGDILLIGSETLSADATVALEKAIGRGCAVLGFMTKANGIFPSTAPAVKSDDAYETVGYFSFEGSNEPLPVLCEFGEICGDYNALGRITAKDGKVHNAYARISDRVWYFSFDLIATLLHAADGRPTYEGCNGFPIARMPDGCILEPDYDYDIAYGDAYLRGIEDVLSSLGFAHMWALPVKENKVCDMALYFGGDDDAFTAENDITAATVMHDLGLPYHINLMPANDKGDYVVTREDVETLHSLGCETALHFNFVEYPFSEEGHRIQMDDYEAKFGKSGGPVNHCLIQVGSAAERYRMECECGCRYDNSRGQNKVNPENINDFNLTGFGFGHAFPRFVIADAAHSNKQLDFCELYMSYYEPRIYNCEDWEYEKIEKYLDETYAYGRTSQLFTHPHYISGKAGFDSEPAVRSLKHMKAYVEKKGWNAWYCAPDALGDWWHDRADCKIDNVTENGFEVNNPLDCAVTVVLPSGATSALINGKQAEVIEKTVAGRKLCLVNIPTGISEISY